MSRGLPSSPGWMALPSLWPFGREHKAQLEISDSDSHTLVHRMPALESPGNVFKTEIPGANSQGFRFRRFITIPKICILKAPSIIKICNRALWPAAHGVYGQRALATSLTPNWHSPLLLPLSDLVFLPLVQYVPPHLYYRYPWGKALLSSFPCQAP